MRENLSTDEIQAYIRRSARELDEKKVDKQRREAATLALRERAAENTSRRERIEDEHRAESACLASIPFVFDDLLVLQLTRSAVIDQLKKHRADGISIYLLLGNLALVQSLLIQTIQTHKSARWTN